MQSPPFPSTNHLAPRYAISSIPQYKSFSSSLCNLLHSPVTSSLLGPNILLNTMFSNTFSFLSSHSVNDQVSLYIMEVICYIRKHQQFVVLYPPTTRMIGLILDIVLISGGGDSLRSLKECGSDDNNVEQRPRQC